MPFKVRDRLYRTNDGRIVGHGDPAGAFLAFTPGQELSDEEARRLGVLAYYATNDSTAQVVEKMAPRARDKAALVKETK
jgi:hypothetical protein